MFGTDQQVPAPCRMIVTIHTQVMSDFVSSSQYMMGCTKGESHPTKRTAGCRSTVTGRPEATSFLGNVYALVRCSSNRPFLAVSHVPHYHPLYSLTLDFVYCPAVHLPNITRHLNNLLLLLVEAFPCSKMMVPVKVGGRLYSLKEAVSVWKHVTYNLFKD